MSFSAFLFPFRKSGRKCNFGRIIIDHR